MKKAIAAVSAGVLLIAGQALAAGETAPRVGDRLGSAPAESSEFAGIPLIGIIAAVGVIAAVVSVASDDSDSD